MPKISLDQFEALVADPATSDAELAEYFILDEAQSGPFAPVYKINPDKVEIPPGPEGAEPRVAEGVSS